MKNTINIKRMTALNVAARNKNLAVVGMQLAAEIILPDELKRDDECRVCRDQEQDQNDFMATWAFVEALRANGFPGAEKFDLRTCGDDEFQSIWAVRQQVDLTGIPYGTYISEALKYLRSNNKKRISIRTLVSLRVMQAVMTKANAGLAARDLAEK